MAKTIVLEDNTHKRLLAVKDDISAVKRRDVNFDDIINFMIDVYNESNAFSGEIAGG